MILTVAKDGWAAVRQRIFVRDRGCVAVQQDIFGEDVAHDQCRDAAGYLMAWDDRFRLEADHVTQVHSHLDPRRDDEAHLITVCPWHHRLSPRWRIDTAERRMAVRAFLVKRYPTCPEARHATP